MRLPPCSLCLRASLMSWFSPLPQLVLSSAIWLVFPLVTAHAQSEQDSGWIRIATFNVSLFGEAPGAIAQRLQGGDDRQARQLAAVIRHVRPDILLINEIDHDGEAAAVDAFVDEYLANQDADPSVGAPLRFPHRWTPESNTGQPSGLDLDRDGNLGEPEDAWGFGRYPGQYGFAILSRLPIDREASRSFQKFRWSDLPDALVPKIPAAGQPYYPVRVWNQLRLSSKNHVDVAIRWNDQRLHVLACHPTPPVFDGPEDRNGCRNHDEIRFWQHYLDGAALRDDQGAVGGLVGWKDGRSGEPFVIMGDLNSDPSQGDSRQSAISGLLDDPRVQDVVPRRSKSSPEVSSATAKFRSGAMRVDYVLPSSNVRVMGSGVFWPNEGEVGHAWIEASDHRLVWVDLVADSDPKGSQP